MNIIGQREGLSCGYADRPLHQTSPLSTRWILGMPHLTCGGLSETWLLKALGHIHWLMLAQAAGARLPVFRDADGNRVYAAFTTVSIVRGDFALAREHDELTVTSVLQRLSATQFQSEHLLSINGRPSGEVVLISVFVKRTVPALNRSIARVEIASFKSWQRRAAESPVCAKSSVIRRGQWFEHMGFSKSAGRAIDRLLIDPCPSQDFNGANFLYFASFQSFADRAEWSWFRDEAARLSTISRDIIYHGNIEIGDRVAVTLHAVRREGPIVAHWMQIDTADGARLADVFTERRSR